jgi:hypothetical protein
MTSRHSDKRIAKAILCLPVRSELSRDPRRGDARAPIRRLPSGSDLLRTNPDGVIIGSITKDIRRNIADLSRNGASGGNVMQREKHETTPGISQGDRKAGRRTRSMSARLFNLENQDTRLEGCDLSQSECELYFVTFTTLLFLAIGFQKRLRRHAYESVEPPG